MALHVEPLAFEFPDDLFMEHVVPPYNIEEYLRAKIEVKNLDYKLGLDWNGCLLEERCGIVKDILAMANTKDGGKIIFGVRNQDFHKVGLSDAEYASFDQTKVNDLLHEYTDPQFTCYVYKHEVEGKKYVCINVPEFPEIPILCKKDANSAKNKPILIRGQLYIRTEKATSVMVPGAQEMRELLGRAIVKKSDELLSNIQRLIKGTPPTVVDDSNERYQREIGEADGFAVSNLGEDLTLLGSWEVTAYPTKYVPKRILDYKTIKEFIRQAQVQLRGWSFPHASTERDANFSQGRQSYTVGFHSEAYRAYESGLFAWRGSFWEDQQELTQSGRKVLSVTDTICFITEIVMFCKRYYELVSPNDTIHFKLVMNGTKDRMLTIRGDAIGLSEDYISRENPIVIAEEMLVVELKASYEEIARKITKNIFDLFNWEIGSEPTINYWQTRLLERRL